MWLRDLTCHGLYSFGDKATEVAFATQRSTIIVGPNNSGKSNIFKLLTLFVNTISGSSSRRLKDYEIFGDTFNPYLQVRITLDPTDIELVLDYLSIYFVRQDSSNVRKFFQFTNRDVLAKALSHLAIKLTWSTSHRRSDGHDLSNIELQFENIGLVLHGRYDGSTLNFSCKELDSSEAGQSQLRLREFLNSLTEENARNKESAVSYFGAGTNDYSAVDDTNNWDSYSPTDSQKRLMARVQAFPEEYSDVNRRTSLIRLIGAIIRTKFFYSSARRSFPAGASLRHTETLNHDGSNLAEFLYNLKVSPKIERRERFAVIQKAFGEIIQSGNLDFDVIVNPRIDPYGMTRGSDENKEQEQILQSFPEVIVIDRTLNKQFPLDQAGSGIGEILFLITASQGINNSMLLLDEPATNLHPPQIKALLHLFFNHLSEAHSKNPYTAIPANKFIIITHSPELAHHSIFEEDTEIIYVRKDARTRVSKILSLPEELGTEIKERQSKLKYIIDSRVFFAGSVILVEGASDENTMLGVSGYLQERDKELNLYQNDVMVINSKGKCNFPTYKRYLDSLEIPYIILADKDIEKDGLLSELSESYSFVTKDGIIGGSDSSNVIVIRAGSLEELFKEINGIAYQKAEAEVKKNNVRYESKPLVAFNFVKEIMNDNDDATEQFKPIRQILEKVVSRNTIPQS